MRVAVAVDGSENALRAAQHAITIVKCLPEAQLEVIYVSDYNKAKEERLLSQSPESLVLKREQKMLPIIELAKEAGVVAKVNMLKGSPSDEIIEYVKLRQ
ncbi:universal stress protein [Ammoniphilus oxalaticus]|uniref:universal stress protein n=1 Tax=Ammoniphilus oxalaticus TaxID=66863 RepID=UPI000E74C347|nr:universal stress protein [Ammoniphilus oxalaticus]